ncbi:MaoC/PaaZ C-terminal domain-containing protein [Arthrobacter sp. zg-Y820]|uniref:MaoC/PaaZ C-terminal domain-containing protein n=1 Tax=unclassified Arthrobacter TaxID=235627 RepID=UPI001E47642B|nr:MULTISPECIES: MaoC/PaaZ C-terminal domain-containing protein [unclassified Arthrobacter]MCC9196783.1 enoyl-CoA hydratase [Arthrobacter sp. zg-Y820]MDK1279645.1 MaoC/PaaZ C-terminal domain-containing protein [Arthrobacter sp. zg.Y820]WIB07985.1 MaoC/PaaZ C-terminal domain-containing protein [Arthrobacter sp. zg-Y820]
MSTDLTGAGSTGTELTGAGAWAGRALGERTVGYTETDAILYALAVGAPAGDLDLVFEDRLRVLPSFGLTLAQWAPDVLAEQGAFDNRAVHGSQELAVLKPLPRSGEILLNARVGEVWDKGAAAVFNVIVECEYFVATWSLFAPGFGGFGGDRGPSKSAALTEEPLGGASVQTVANQAALYRLLGDRHHIHIDPQAAERIGQKRPILHGLASLASATLPLAELAGAHPADLVQLAGRFAGVVFPGDEITVRTWEGGRFDARVGDQPVITEGLAVFG